MFFWNFLALSMIQWMLAIWPLDPLPFLNPVWTSRSAWFMYCWSLAWRILSITLLACEMSAIVWFSSVQSFSRVWLFAASQASLSITNSRSLPKLMSIEAVMPSYVVPFSSHPQSFPASESFQMNHLFASGGQNIGVSASTTVLRSLSILWHGLSLGLAWKLAFSSPVATAEFSEFAGIVSAADLK